MSDGPEDLLPGNATDFERAHSKTSARILDTDTDVIRRARDAMQTPEALLPFLAAERGVDHYQGDLATRRARTRDSFDDKLRAGCPSRLEEQVTLDTGVPVVVSEFFQERQFTWPDFAVDAVLAPGDEPPDLAPIARSAARRKNPRDTLAAVRPRYVNPPGDLYYGAAAHFSPRIRNVFAPVANRHHGAASRFMPQQRIRP